MTHTADTSEAPGAPDASARFSGDWLSLREPFDTAARDASAQVLGLGQHFKALAPPTGPWRVMDLGCGTGANLRWLAPRLGGAQQWLVLDHDTDLLGQWPERLGVSELSDGRLRWAGHGWRTQVVRQRCDLSSGLQTLPWHAAHLVTGSALLDLVGEVWLQRLADLAATFGAALLFALSVDGRHAWSPPDAADGLIARLFDAHQQRDKGLGPALGARAVPMLARLLRARGYRVFTARSDWRIDPAAPAGDANAMQRAMVQGMAGAAMEQDGAQRDAVQAWQQRRLQAADSSSLRVGHLDLLALPPR